MIRKKVKCSLLPMILLLPAAVLFLGGCSLLAQLEKPEIKKITPHITGIDFQGIDMRFDIDIANPYPIRLQTPGFDYGFKVEGASLFESNSETSIDLPASETGTVPLPMRFKYLDLISSAKSIANKPEAGYEFFGKFLFKPYGRQMELPFSHQGTLPILKLPKISVKDIKLTDVGLTGAKLTIDSNITNPNIFGINLKDMGYNFQLGDLKIGGLSASTLSEIGAGQDGALGLTGEVSGISAIRSLMKGVDIGKAQIKPAGSIKTPYGSVKLP